MSSSQNTTMILGIHGVLEMKPWLRPAYDDDTYEEDMHSLILARTTAYGFGFLSEGDPSCELWWHNDAAEDWTQDGLVHEVAMFQSMIPPERKGHRLPIRPAATIMEESLRRVGDLDLAAFHALIPLHMSTADDRLNLLYAQNWFSLSSPDATAQIIVSISVRDQDKTAELASQVQAAAADGGADHMTVSPTTPDVVDQEALAGELHWHPSSEDLSLGLVYQCQVPEWSMDAAVWATEVFADALRASGITTSVLITTSHQEIKATG
ncbi:hypothetical protein ACQEU3_46005 [Spirillospora sp. CA-253888]